MEIILLIGIAAAFGILIKWLSTDDTKDIEVKKDDRNS